MSFAFLRPWLQQHKCCRMCGAIKPATDFYPQKRGKFGVMGKCKECWKEYMKAYYSRKKAA